MVGTSFVKLKHKDLPNWGRFSRSYLPPLREAMNPIYDFIVHDEHEGHGDLLELLQMVRAGKLPLSLVANLRPGPGRDEGKIREDDAQEIDGYMAKMMHQAENSRRTLRNYRIIKNEFYRREMTKRHRPWSVQQEDLDAAIRALMDLIFGVRKQRI
jgi:hypothetical protein